MFETLESNKGISPKHTNSTPKGRGSVFEVEEFSAEAAIVTRVAEAATES